MSIDKTRTNVTAQIWQAIAQSNIELSSIPKDDQEKLVREIADSMLLMFDSMIQEEVGTEEEIKSTETANDEIILWQGRPFLSLVESYIITSERIKIVSGFVSRHVENYELIRIQDIDFRQNVGERVFGLGDINIKGQDPSDPNIILRNIAKPEKIYELLRRAWLEARKRYGLQFREYM